MKAERWPIRVNGEIKRLTLAQLRAVSDEAFSLLKRHDGKINNAIRLVCANRGLTEKELFEHKRPYYLCLSRWCLWKLLAEQPMTYGDIGRLCGWDRRSVELGVRRLIELLETDAKAKKELQWLINEENQAKD